MKKIIPVVVFLLLFSMAFAGCKKSDSGETTLNITQPTATTTAAESMTDSVITSAAGYVLTTQAGETVPTVITTAFDPSADVNGIPDTGMTIPDVTIPVVVTDMVTTTVAAPGEGEPTASVPASSDASDPNASNSDPAASDNTTEATKSPTEASTTTQINEEISNNESTEPEDSSNGNGSAETTETTYKSDETTSRRNLKCIGSANDERGNVTIMFDYSDWDRVKSQKASAKVSCNGKTKTLKGTINGAHKSTDGQFEFIVDISSLNPSSGDYITVTLTSGAVEELGGSVKSNAITTYHYYA